MQLPSWPARRLRPVDAPGRARLTPKSAVAGQLPAQVAGNLANAARAVVIAGELREVCGMATGDDARTRDPYAGKVVS